MFVKCRDQRACGHPTMSAVPTAYYSRVTLVAGTRRVDLAVPGAVPLADVMPQLLRLCAPAGDAQQPVPWTLGRLGGTNLSLTTTLQDAAVADGEVLELRAPQPVVRPAYVEDVRDAVEDAVDESGRRWRPRTTAGFALAVAAGLLACAVLLPEAQRPRDPVALTTAAVVAALGVLAAWWSDRSGHRHATHAVVATAGLWGGVGGWLASTYHTVSGSAPQVPLGAGPWPTSLAVALAAGLAVVALARAVTAVATGHLAAAALLAAAGLPLAVAGDWLTAVRVDAVLSVLVIGVLPRVSLTVGGLASDDYRVRRGGLVGGAELAARIRHSTALLYGGLAAASVIGLVSGVALANVGSTWDRLLGSAVGLALVLRSRVFSRVPQIVPPRVAGLVVLVAQGLRSGRETLHTGPWLVFWAAAVATVLVAASAIPLSDVARARVKQLLNLAEMLVVVAMVALAAGALGGYDWVGRATA
jgi:type VII secretion integral membrane protein EccD